MSRIAIKLTGGPEPFDGWSSIYEGEALGWPPPDEIMAHEIAGIVAVANPADVPTGTDLWRRYRKVRQSKLTDEEAAGYEFIVRGAEYEAVEP